MDFKKDYYMILGVASKATQEDLRASYRRLAKVHHPDKNPGNVAAEEKFKEINEAHEILCDMTSRNIYDEYRRQAGQSEHSRDDVATKDPVNIRTHYYTKTVTRERKLYIKGKIIAKFWGERNMEANTTVQWDIDYTIVPTDALVLIVSSDMYEFEIPDDYKESYDLAKAIILGLQKAVHCKIFTPSGFEFYDLEIHEMRIRNPIIKDITKYEGRSFGVLEAELFGFILKVEQKDVREKVTECFGPTGRSESKSDGGFTYSRKEFFYKNCSTFWGPWQIYGNKTNTQKPKVVIMERENRWDWWWLIFLLLLVILFPLFTLFGLLVVGVILLLNWVGNLGTVLGRFAGLLFSLLFILVVCTALYSFFSVESASPLIRKDTKREDKIAVMDNPLKTTIPEPDRIDGKKDTLISHYWEWKDYDGNSYAATFSVFTSDIGSSSVLHENMDEQYFSRFGMGAVYSYLEKMDTGKLRNIYAVFDSIRIHRNLNNSDFAKLVVSCIQSIPFFLIVDKSCGETYNDEFITSYLANCRTDCCVGNIKFGVLSPIEFFRELKGDCDTRALLIYTILAKFHYNVALLISNYYGHALVAVNFEEFSDEGGLAINIQGRTYYLWETTASGFRPGKIPDAISNLAYWNIALLTQTD